MSDPSRPRKDAQTATTCDGVKVHPDDWVWIKYGPRKGDKVQVKAITGTARYMRLVLYDGSELRRGEVLGRKPPYAKE